MSRHPIALPLWFVSILLAVAPATAAPGSTITLELSDPQYCACGWTSINGYVQSDDPLWTLIWDWGDGTRTTSMFPAAHRYAADGTYTVTATAASCTNQGATVQVTISGATGSGCPTDEAPACGAYGCRYVAPSNLHLTQGGAAGGPLSVVDGNGAAAQGTAVFTASDPTLVSIAADGHVLALRSETATEIGTWISATLDGRAAANACVARVLQADHGVAFGESTGVHTAIRYPLAIGGEDIDALVRDYQITTVNELAYAIETDLGGLRPFDGCRQLFEVDFGEGESNRVCGISGNPVRLGWNITGDAWQNCFLVPFLEPRSPQWTVFYHELGHNVTLSSIAFSNEFGSTWQYTEGLATAMSLAAVHRVLGNAAVSGLGAPAIESLQFLYRRDTSGLSGAYESWLARGAPFGELDADIVSGIWLHHAGTDLDRFAGRFFFPLAPAWVDGLGGVLCRAGSETAPHTFFAALVSAAAGTDLSATFANTYHFPLDHAYFVDAYTALLTTLDGNASGRVTGLVLSRSGSSVTLSWDPSCATADSDYAVYEGRLGAFYSDAPRACSTGGARSLTLAPAPGPTYYVVAPRSAFREGSHGLRGDGTERPPGVDWCAPQLVAACP